GLRKLHQPGARLRRRRRDGPDDRLRRGIHRVGHRFLRERGLRRHLLSRQLTRDHESQRRAVFVLVVTAHGTGRNAARHPVRPRCRFRRADPARRHAQRGAVQRLCAVSRREFRHPPVRAALG
ncbi:MAG: hypothetical protein ACK55I_30275, partial [bacterium]